MTWQEYYKVVDECESEKALSWFSKLEELGPADEVFEAIMLLALDDEEKAIVLLEMANDAGLKFSSEQLVHLCLFDQSSEVERAIRFAADGFSSKDIEELYDCYDNDLLLEIVEKQKINLTPEALALFEEAEEEDFDFSEAAEEEEAKEPEEDDIDYAYALECLWQAHEKVKEAYWLALADASSKKQAVSLAKYDDLAEAGPYLDAALAEVTGLELASKVNLTYCVSQLKMDNLTLFHDIYLDSSFGDLRLRDQIMKLLEAIKEMHEEVERMWNGINAK